MKRWTISLLLVFLFGTIAALAQQDSAKPAPGTNDVIGPQLIAWSEMQKPQPVPQQPQPLPPPDNAQQKDNQTSPPSEAQGERDQADKDQQPEPDTQQSVSKSMTGMIAKVGGKYVFETADGTAYQIDDQDKAKHYEGKHVKIMGTVDRTTGMIHVTSIELIS